VVEVDPRIGSEIAGYRIEAVVGRVHTGVVYLARDVRLDRPVVLHLVAEGPGGDGAFRERVLREARLAASLEHPHIVPVYDVGAADGRLYVAVPQVDGADLAALLAGNGGLAPERTLAIVAQLAAALDHARFARGLVHGHLDPGDVLVTPAADGVPGEQARLRGFGLRQELPPGATASEAVQRLGTVAYLAPEQLEGKQVTPRTDVYALGCLLCHCLTGEPPFTGAPADVVRAHLHEPPPSAKRCRPGLPAEIDRVIAKAMAKWPEERYSACAELAAAAQAALAGRGQPEQAHLSSVSSPARPGPVFEEPPFSDIAESDPNSPLSTLAQRLRASKRAVAAGIGLVALVALVAGVIWLVGRDPSDAPSAEPDLTPPAAETQGEIAAIGGETPAAPVVVGGSLVRLDATTGEVVATVPLDGTPLSVAADDRYVWVVDDSGTLSRIDAGSNQVTATFDAPESADDFPGLLAAGEDVLLTRWLGENRGVEVLHLAAGSDAFERFDLPDSGWWLNPVIAGGSLWVSVGEPPGPTEVLRVDPETGSVLARLKGLWGYLIAAGDFVWVADLEKQEFIRVDTETNELSKPSKEHFFPAGEGRPAAAFGDGMVWVLGPGQTLFGLDRATGEQLYEFPVARSVGRELAAGGGAVWTTSASGGIVYRHEIKHQDEPLGLGGLAIDVGGTPQPFSLAIAGDAVWVGVAALAREDGDTAGSASSEPPEAELPAERAGDDLAEPVLSRVPGSLVRIDAATGKITARLAVPSPTLLASDGRSVWVLSDDEPGDKLFRIDAATNAVTDSFDVDVAGVAAEFGLAVAGGSAWLSHVNGGPLYRFTPGASAGEAAQIENEGGAFLSPFGGAGSLWVWNGEEGGGVLRVDPDSERILADLEPIDQVVAAAPGFVWALDDPLGPNPGLVRIDTETNAVAPLGDAPGWPWLDYNFAAADGALWVSDAQPGTIDTIVRLDAVTGEVEGEIDLVPSPGPIAAGGGAVWAASREAAYPWSSTRTLARYDIATGRVKRIVVGGTPRRLVFARGSVWVAVPGLELRGDSEPVGTDRLLLTVDRVLFSFSLQTGDSWERFGSTSINKWLSGGQDAEAVIFWNTLPSDENADPCAPLPGASAADIAAAVASAPGTELVAGPSDVTVGGRAAKHVVLTVREDAGCDPGFFFTWPPQDGGAPWLGTMRGDTIRVWIVDVDGTHFVIEAETRSEVGSDLDQEIQQFVDSIRFDGSRNR